MSGGFPWTDEELATLRTLSVDHTCDQISEILLRRSSRACEAKLIELRIGRCKTRGDRGVTNPNKRHYGPKFFVETPLPSDNAKHLGLILKKHGTGFPYYARVPV